MIVFSCVTGLKETAEDLVKRRKGWLSTSPLMEAEIDNIKSFSGFSVGSCINEEGSYLILT